MAKVVVNKGARRKSTLSDYGGETGELSGKFSLSCFSPLLFQHTLDRHLNRTRNAARIAVCFPLGDGLPAPFAHAQRLGQALLGKAKDFTCGAEISGRQRLRLRA
jgi:hypothetical protein